MRLNEEIFNESVKKINNIMATYSLFDLRNILENSKKPMRIIYCPDTEIWAVGEAEHCYHPYMVGDLQDEGLTNINVDETYGHFYYIPAKYTDLLDTYQLLYIDFAEVREVEVFDDCILGCSDTSTNPGKDIFFSLFKNPIKGPINIDDLLGNGK